MPSSICFDSETRSFTLRLKTSAYLLKILPDGEVMHAGFVPLPEGAAPSLAPARLADYGDPNYVWEAQAQPFEYPAFGDISHHEVAFKASFPSAPGQLQPGEAPNLPVRDVRLRYHGHEIRNDAQPLGAPAHGRPAKNNGPRETLLLRLKDAAYDFWVTLCYRLTPEHDLIERWVEIKNGTRENVEIDIADFGVLHLPPGRYEATRAAGGWAREFVAERHRLEQGTFVLDQRGLNTGHASNPFFLVNECGKAGEESGTVHFGAIAWSGNWRLRFEALPTGPCRVFAGYEASDFALTLAPGESHLTPACLFGCSPAGRGGASRRLHAFIRERVLPGFADDEFRPVLYNSWEATYFDLSLEKQSELARIAASVGIELFVVDDGWFGARRNDRAGLGDWVVSPRVFPEGLKPLIDEVRRLGMKFGLWVEPEMVNPDSDLYRAHPDWVLHFPGRPRTEKGYRNQLILDFGRPEVVDHIFGVLDSLVRENGIDFFKWDMNRYVTEPGSVAGKAIWRRHVEGLYRILDRLRKNHPRLDIQSCSGGGGRIDPGILARADQVWTSDNTDARDRVFIEDGFSLAYPARVMESWVTHDTNHQTGMSHSLDLRFDAAMRGALGIGSAINQLSPGDLEIYRNKIAFYKKIRPVVQGGDLYRLQTASESGCSIWLTVLPDASRAVYSAIVLAQLQGIYLAPQRLRALDAAASYAVIDEQGRELGRYPGWQLMSLGLPGDSGYSGLGCATRSRTLLLEKTG